MVSDEKCCCGRHEDFLLLSKELDALSPRDEPPFPRKSEPAKTETTSCLMMEASFVHLNRSSVSKNGGVPVSPSEIRLRLVNKHRGQFSSLSMSRNIHSGLLDAAHHTSQLVKAASQEGQFNKEKDDPATTKSGNETRSGGRSEEFPCLCGSCVTR
jgi:hypothetical protein